MKGIVIRTDDTIEVVDVDPGWEALGKIVGGYIEIVRRGPYLGRDGSGTVMVVNEDGRGMGLPVNRLGSWMYGTQFHGQPIVGDVLLLREEMTGEGADFTDVFVPDALVVSLRTLLAGLPR